jgi:hypothetical protein
MLTLQALVKEKALMRLSHEGCARHTSRRIAESTAGWRSTRKSRNHLGASTTIRVRRLRPLEC